MKALVLLVLLCSLLVECWTSPSPLLLSDTPQPSVQYLFPGSELDNSKTNVISNDLPPTVPIVPPPLTNSNDLNAHDKNVINMKEENEGQKRLKLFYNRLAEKFRTELLNKISKSNYDQNPLKEHESDQRVPTNKQEDLDLVSGRKNFIDANFKDLDQVLALSYGIDNPSEFYNLNTLNDLTNKINDNLKLGFLESGSLPNYNDDSIKEFYLEPIDQNLPVLRYPSKVFVNTFDTIPNTYNSQLRLIPSQYFYRQPIFGIKDRIKSLYNTIKYPFLDFKNHLFKDRNLHKTKQDQHEVENIKKWITQLMGAHKYSNPLILQIINDANEFDLTKLENLDQSQLIKLSESDLETLKTYFMLILNKYGITPYTYKLLEFINLVGGKPKDGSYLLYNILNNQKAVQTLNHKEINQIKQHLEQILQEYGNSPYILPFVLSIDGIQLVPNNEKLYIYDFDFFDSSNYVSKDDMKKAYLYLLESYKNNAYIVKVLQNLNEIYEKSVTNGALPVLYLKDLQNLSFLNYHDLNLFLKYMSQIIKQRGKNTYIDQLLTHLEQLKTQFDKEKHMKNVTHEHDFNKRLNLSGVFEYLLHLNKTGITNSHIIDILKRLNLSNDIDVSIITLNNSVINENDLNRISEFLEQLTREDKQEKKSSPPITLDDTIDIKFDDLQEIFHYLLNQHNIIKSPYIIIILNLLRQAQNQPYTNGFIKVRFHDLEQIYNYLTLTQGDTANPIFIKIRYYVNQINKNKEFDKKNEIISDEQIDLYEIYNFLLHKVKSEKVDPRLLEILQYLNTTFVLPNGELKVRTLSFNNTESLDGINPNDLHNLLLYIKNIKENQVLYNELLQYVQERLNNEYEQNILILSAASRDSLNRIKNFLLTFSKEHGESQYVSQILLKINRMLGLPDNDDNHVHILNDTDSKINNNDLDILTKYISAVKVSNSNRDVIKLSEKIREYRDKIKNDKVKLDQLAQFNVFFLQIINNDQVSPALRDTIKYIYLDIAVDHLNYKIDFTILNANEKKRLSALNSNDLYVLVTYLKEFLRIFGPNPRVQQILFYIDEIKQNEKKEEDRPIELNRTDFKEGEKNINIIKISKDSLNFINRYLLDLINLYGKDSNIMHLIYAINNLKETPDQGSDLTKIITNNNVGFLKLEDINTLRQYLLKLIQKHGANSHLMKILRVINKLNGRSEENTDRPILQVNGTHTLVVLERDDITRIKSYLIDIINNYGSNPFLINILNVINVLDIESNKNNNIFNNANPNVYTFSRISRSELNQLIQYILQLIEKLGTRDDLLDLLDFVYRIYGDADQGKDEKEKEQSVLEILKEIKNLRKRGVIETMQNMEKGVRTAMYLQLLQKIFAGTSSVVNIELPTILEKLLNMYKVEVDLVRKYVILKLYEYLFKNKGGYENFWKPGFLDIVLDVKDDLSDDNNVIVEPYDYSKDIETVLKIIVNDTINKTWKTNHTEEPIKKELFNFTIPDNHEKKSNYKKVACLTAYTKLEDIWRIINGLITLKGVDSDFTIDDLNRMIDMFLIFKKKLSRELNRDSIPTKIVIDELEKILLSHHLGKCDQAVQYDSTTFMAPIVESLRNGILYMKLNHFTDDLIKDIVEATLVENILPELKSRTVQECVVRTKKELLNGLYNNIFKNDYDIEMTGNKMKTKVTQELQPTAAPI